MSSFNKVILMGNLTRDPELRHTPTNTAVAEFGLAVNERYTGKDGVAKERVTFVDITVWGKQAETADKYLKKGRSVLVEGRLQLDQWESKEGEKRSKLRVVCEHFTFVGSRDDSGGGGSAAGGGSAGGGDGGSAPASSGGGDDDLPF